MEYTLVTAVLCLAILRLSEGTVPAFTNGTTQSKNLAENTPAAGTAFNVTTTAVVSLYSLGGADAASFDVIPLTGSGATTAEVTIKASPVFATKPTYTVTVIAADAATPADNVTVTVTVNVIKIPAFTAASLTATACAGITTGTVTTTGQLTATVSTDRTPVYAIASGNTGSLLSISTTTGQISVASSQTLIAANYTLVVTAADNTAPVQTGTTTIVITVSASACSGSAAITGSLVALLCMSFSIIQKLD